jgi:hypothetical protein
MGIGQKPVGASSGEAHVNSTKTSVLSTILRSVSLLRCARGGGGMGLILAPTISASERRIMGVILTGSLALAGCAGGGGGNLAASVPQQSSPSPASPSPSPTSFLPLPSIGYGPTPVPAQLAYPGGASFTGISGFPAANTSFPVLASSLIVTDAASAPQASITAIPMSSALDTAIQISVPSLNLSVTVPLNVSAILSTWGSFADPLDYVALAGWQFSNPAGSQPSVKINGVGVFGYQTPAAAIPVSGTASFSGPATANFYNVTGEAITNLIAFGNGALSVDFASGKISGQFGLLLSDVRAGGDLNWPWNTISVSANIAAGTNAFAGTTAVASPPGPCGCSGRSPELQTLPVVLDSSATGVIAGAFYGPAAQNLGAVWSIGDSHLTVLGTIRGAR